MSVARLGYRVALIDADIGLRNLDLLLGLENRVMYTAMEVLDGECRLEQVRGGGVAGSLERLVCALSGVCADACCAAASTRR